MNERRRISMTARRGLDMVASFGEADGQGCVTGVLEN